MKSTHVMQNDVRVKIPLIHGVGASNHLIIEERMASFARASTESKPGLALDVGANVGAFLIQLQSLGWFKREGTYLGFEPNPLCAHYVKELARLNQIDAVDCVCAALSEEAALPTLYGYRPADKMASLTSDFAHRPHRKHDFSSRVIAETGDVMLSRIGSPPISILKIDVEGHEGDVLVGLAESVRVSQPWIFCEMWDFEERTGGATEDDLARRQEAFETLRQVDYLAYDNDMRRNRLADMDLESFNKLGGADVIFIPRIEVDIFEAAWR